MTVTNEITEKKPKVVEALFNKKFTIELPEGELTGLQIKQHAIEQDVPIRPSYVLFLIKNKNHRQLIGDTDVVTIRKGLEFAALADDDNS